jgi:hypothetical protein
VLELGLIAAYIPDYKVGMSFIAVSVAAGAIGQSMAANLGFPLITGYLVCGLVAGPFMLNLIPEDEIRSLRMMDELSLAYIALSAGSKFYLPSMKPVKAALGYLSFVLVFLEYIVGIIVLMIMAPQLKKVQDMNMTQRFGVACLCGVMMVARSPSAVIAVVTEVKAVGRYTNLVLGVTILCDAVVLLFFNLNDLIASFLLAAPGDPGTKSAWGVIGEFVGQVVVSSLGGVLFGLLLLVAIFWPSPHGISPSKQRIFDLIRSIILIFLCILVFVVSHLIEPFLDPLFFFLVAGAFIVNYTNAKEQFSHIMHDLANPVFICFFTLTGAALKLSILGEAMAISSVLVLTRLASIYLGSMIGLKWGKEKDARLKNLWSGYITQAGVTLGLAKKVHLNYPDWGDYFATMIFGCVLLNQVMGPPLLRWGLIKSGDVATGDDAHKPGKVVIDGDEDGENESLIQQLTTGGWNVLEANSKSGTVRETIDGAETLSPTATITSDETVEIQGDKKSGSGSYAMVKRTLSDDEVTISLDSVADATVDAGEGSPLSPAQPPSPRLTRTGSVGSRLTRKVSLGVLQKDAAAEGDPENPLGSDSGFKVKKKRGLPKECCGGYCNWVMAHFSMEGEIARFFAAYESPELNFIYSLLHMYDPIDCYIITKTNQEDIIGLAKTICRCHKIVAKKSHRHLRIVVIVKDQALATNEEFLVGLNDVTAQTASQEYVSIGLVDPSSAGSNLLDIAVRGGANAAWLAPNKHLQRYSQSQVGKKTKGTGVQSVFKRIGQEAIQGTGLQL